MGVDWDTALKRDIDAVISLARQRRNDRVHQQAAEIQDLHERKLLSVSGPTALAIVKAWPKAYRKLVSLQTRMYLGERM